MSVRLSCASSYEVIYFAKRPVRTQYLYGGAMFPDQKRARRSGNVTTGRL